MKMNRRHMVGALITGIAGPLVSRELLTLDGAWIVVATRGWNLNQRAYTEAALNSMAAGLKGTMVMFDGKDLFPEEGDLSKAHGLVTKSKRGEGGEVIVKVRWFTGKEPLTDGVLTPTGTGKLEEKAPGFHWVTSYAPSFLVFNHALSAFEGATKL